MAERIIRQLIDDLDQTEIVDGKGGAVEFGLRGTTYTIDLTATNIAKLERALAPFVAVATRVSGPDPARSTSTAGRKKRSSRRAAKRPATKTTAAVRAWAAENGHEVSPRGRIPVAVNDAYDAAHEPAK